MGIRDMKRNLKRQQQRNVPQIAAFIKKNLLGKLNCLVGLLGERERKKGKRDFIRVKGRP